MWKTVKTFIKKKCTFAKNKHNIKLMKNSFVLLVLLVTSQFFGQNDQRTAFQKCKYELAVSYYEKDDFEKAIDLFSLAAKIKPENKIGLESSKKVDTLREVLRKNILKNALGNWKKIGNQPLWSNSAKTDKSQLGADEIVEITENEIAFFEVNKKTKEKKLLKKENLTYNDKNNISSLFSEIIFSDGKIWNCSINQKSNTLHVINVGVKTKKGIEKIKGDSEESYYVKI